MKQINEIPPEILLYILSFLDNPKDIASVAQVNKLFQSLTTDVSLLTDLFKKSDLTDENISKLLSKAAELNRIDILEGLLNADKLNARQKRVLLRWAAVSNSKVIMEAILNLREQREENLEGAIKEIQTLQDRYELTNEAKSILDNASIKYVKRLQTKDPIQTLRHLLPKGPGHRETIFELMTNNPMIAAKIETELEKDFDLQNNAMRLFSDFLRTGDQDLINLFASKLSKSNLIMLSVIALHNKNNMPNAELFINSNPELCEKLSEYRNFVTEKQKSLVIELSQKKKVIFKKHDAKEIADFAKLLNILRDRPDIPISKIKDDLKTKFPKIANEKIITIFFTELEDKQKKLIESASLVPKQSVR